VSSTLDGLVAGLDIEDLLGVVDPRRVPVDRERRLRRS
jgi:hypothetical protein